MELCGFAESGFEGANLFESFRIFESCQLGFDALEPLAVGRLTPGEEGHCDEDRDEDRQSPPA
jgi:hypothetical protein